jgi:hypothetical protein
MKTILTTTITFLFLLTTLAEKIQISVSIEGSRNTFKLKKQIEAKAQKGAIKKYILKLNSQTPEKILNDATNEYSIFAKHVKTLTTQWTSIDTNLGQLSGDFLVTIDSAKLNSYLKEKGFSHSEAITLVIMEEPPSLGQIQLNKAFGTTLNGQKFFMQNYTTFQRRIRDAIIKKVDNYGFDVKLLSDNALYEKYKDKDSNLVGVYFDVTSDEFVINRNLLNAVKANNPDTLVLYYRIDALIFNKETSKITATVGFTLKNLNTNVTKVFGTPQTMELSISSTNPEKIMDDFAFCVESAINILMNDEQAGSQLNKIAMSIRNSQLQVSGPVKLIINASAFDPKVRLRAMYMLKKELITQSVISNSQSKSSRTTLTAIVTNSKIQAPDVLYMEYILPILTKLNIELSDDKVHYNGNTLLIQP